MDAVEGLAPELAQHFVLPTCPATSVFSPEVELDTAYESMVWDIGPRGKTPDLGML